ncbi:hypothetical protein [Achromobacter phage Motura]|uniref:Uncharacterized protein n=1 Tax=Achromobacter phage Motura TaxID=2591403 RepID=A0A514CSK7_9CAUD|nr:hypothetical protein H1O15_gp053 [Achromobacter phage Motura]QDH83461.1 hypothetical protein [Achromobacter phage Motura]
MNPNTKLSLPIIELYVAQFTYTVLPSGRAIVCEATLNNGHCVHGIANVIDIENFDQAAGESAAKRKALDAVAEYAAYDMQTQISRIRMGVTPDTLGVLKK